MKITDTNVLKVAACGATLYWILALICFAHDYATGDLNTKNGWLPAFVFLITFCGLAFYLILTPSLIGSVRSVRNSQARNRIGNILWAISPLPILFISATIVAYVVLRAN